jgi:serine/threonine protein kinase/tetratricopeptide (TPR) repeat protein
MSSSNDERGPVELLADEFLARCKRGEKPTIKEYCDRHPDLAGEIRDVFEALLMVEDLKPGSSNASGSWGESATADGKRLEQVGDYRIVGEIGRGGMGVVYEADQQALGRRVALKVLPRTSAGDGSAQIRFQREAKAAARMHRTNIVPVFDVGQDGEYLYYAMQLIHGQGLDLVIEDLKHLRAQTGATAGVPDGAANRSIAASLAAGKFEKENLAAEGENDAKATAAYAGRTPSSAVLPGQSEIATVTSNRGVYFRSLAQIGVQTASALSYAHSRGIIHRDIKPGNLILDTTGNVWVTDFGLAKTGDGGMTHTGDILGTVRYMSPERFRGQCDVRADVYALGMTLYEMLTLKAAYASGDRLKLIDLIRHTEASSPRSIDARIPRDLETIVMKAIDKDPKRRYQSADEMGEDLERFVNDEPIKARRIGVAERFTRWCRRNPAVAGSMAAVLLVMAVGTAVSLWQAVRAEESERQALAALVAAKDAKETAEASEAEAKAVLDFVQNKVFAAARPEGAEGGLGHDVTLRKAIEAALPFVDRSFTKQPLIEARLRMTLAISFWHLGEWKIAAEQSERARPLFTKHLGPDHPDTLWCNVSLAISYLHLGRGSEAIDLLEHALPLLKAKSPHDQATLGCMNNLAICYLTAGRTREGLKLQEETLELEKAIGGPDHATTLGSMVNVAKGYRDAGRLTDAIKLLEQALPVMKTKMPDHEFTFIGMSSLAGYYAEAGRTREALKLYEETVARMKAKLGPNHPHTLGGMYELAEACAVAGRFPQALKLFEELLWRHKAKHGLDHSDTLNIMVMLGQCYREVGRPGDAIRLLEQALPILKARMPKDRRTLNCMNALGTCYCAVRRIPEAIKFQEETVQLYKGKRGPNAAETLGCMVNLAVSYQAAGRLTDAIKLLEEALPVMKAKMPGHRYTFNCMAHLASSYGVAGRIQEALKLLEEAFQLRKAKLGPDHPDTFQCMVNLAFYYHQVGRDRDAVGLLEQGLPIRKARMPDHESTLNCMNCLGICYRALGRTKEAIKLQEETFQLYKTKVGPHAPDTLGSMVNLAVSYQEAGRLKGAIKLLEEALPVMKARMPKHEFTFNCMNELSNCYHAAGRPKEALKLREDMLQLSKAWRGPANPHVLGNMVNLAIGYQAVGRLTDAVKLLEEALAVMKARMPDHEFTFNCMINLANCYAEAGRTQEALKLHEETVSLTTARLGPNHPHPLAALDRASLAFLAVATQQAWFGQDREWAATCERALSLARDTKSAAVADKVAKMCSLRPSNDQRRQAALRLARRAVELGKGQPYQAWFQMTLGMAEYRSGHFAAADAALTAAIRAGKNNPYLTGTSAFYRAMSLFRQKKPNKARQLVTQAATKMKPLPREAKNPLVSGANGDDLILWLACKEAQNLIKIDAKKE